MKRVLVSEVTVSSLYIVDAATSIKQDSAGAMIFEDAVGGPYELSELAAGVGGVSSMEDLSDVVISSAGADDGDVLVYGGSSGFWTPQAQSGGSMVYPGAGIALSTGEAWGSPVANNSATWNNAQAGHANLTSLAALSYVSASFVKMTAAGTFALDTATYNNYTHPNHSGQVTSSADGATVVTVSAITAQTEGTEIADTDEFLYSDGGVIKRIDASILKTYAGAAVAATNPFYVGDDSSVRTSGYEATVNISATGASEQASLELVGNVTASGIVAAISFHNVAAGAADERIVQLSALRHSSNDTGEFKIHLQGSTGGIAEVYEVNQTSHTWSILGTSELILSASYLYPSTAGGLMLGVSSVPFSETHTNTLYLHDSAESAQDWKLVFNTTSELVFYESDVSDLRLKTDLVPITNVLPRLMQLTGYSFDFNDLAQTATGQRTDRRRSGLVYQEVVAQFPDTCHLIDSTVYGSVRYDDFVGVLVEAIKEQQDIIETQQATIEAHQVVIDYIKDRFKL